MAHGVPARHRRSQPGSDVWCKTRIEHAQTIEAVKRIGIALHMIGLTKRFLVPMQPKPAKVFKDTLLEFGATTTVIDIFDPELKAPIACFGGLPGKER